MKRFVVCSCYGKEGKLSGTSGGKGNRLMQNIRRKGHRENTQ